MNKVFQSYRSSSNFFLTGISDVSVKSSKEYLQSIPISLTYDYSFLDNGKVTEFRAEQGSFNFYEISDNNVGFLGKVAQAVDNTSEIDNLHYELFTVFGSIIDSFSTDSNKELLPLIDVFSIDDETLGLGIFHEDYLDKCVRSSLEPNPYLSKLRTLAVEANGNLVQYNADSELFFYLTDQTLYDDSFVLLDQVPASTFYRSESLKNVKEWVDFYFQQYR